MSALPQSSFTQLWEHGLNHRFGATIFVPKEPGDTLRGGELTVIDQLAYGGLAAVYLVRHKDGRELVLKEFVLPASTDEAFSSKAREMFQREGELLCSLDHPQIVAVHDHFVEDGQNYLLMDFVRGVSLRRLVMDKGARDEKLVLHWIIEIAGILNYLHERTPPILHRDLTPDNLMINAEGKICLIDFGAANTFLGTATGTLVGKQAYIAPEQFRGKATVASDIYALGCTTYFLLTAEDPEPLAQSNPQLSKPSVSAELSELVQKLTALETETRFHNAAAVCKQAKAILSGARSGQQTGVPV